MGRLGDLLIGVVSRRSARRFEAATHEPRARQEALLQRILRLNRDTEYGRSYAFHTLRDLDDWRAVVPVVEYEELRPFIDRMMAGESGVLTAERPLMFARTSGTTGAAKSIPVTPTCQDVAHEDQMRSWIHHARRDHPGLFRGAVVSLVSPAVEGRTTAGIPFGSTSGVIYRDMPAVVRRTYAIPYEVFEVRDYEAKYYLVMRLSMARRVSFLSSANPSSILMLAETADRRSEELIRGIRDGTLGAELAIPDDQRRRFERSLRADPERARTLEGLRSKRSGRLLPGDYWPELALIGCWKGGTVGASIDRFPAWFWPDGERGEVAVRDWGYLSSEARGSVPLSDEGSGGVLTVDSNIFEFVEVNELENHPGDPRAWTFRYVDEVELGREYYVFLTTTGGLYRYDINDVVEVVDLYNRTPVIVFRRKGRGMTNITGEKLSVNQVIEAFRRAGDELGLVVDHFKAEADVPESRYLFKIETRDALPPSRLRPLLHAVDRHLGELNLEYLAKRQSLRLKDPSLYVMKTGWYERNKKRLVAEGKRLWQAKTELLSRKRGTPDDDRVEAIVTFRG